MGLWIRLDKPDDLETRVSRDHPPTGEWCSLPEAIRIIREHNEREARREQVPGWFEDVTDELRRARAKFPGTDLLTTAFAEEAGELVKAILDGYNGKESDIYTEAIQTIAMVVRLLEEGDLVHRLAPIVTPEAWYPSECHGHSLAPATTPPEKATPEPWNKESSEGILQLVNERDRLRDQVSRLQEERDAALDRAVLAERANADLLADLREILQGFSSTTVEKESA